MDHQEVGFVPLPWVTLHWAVGVLLYKGLLQHNRSHCLIQGFSQGKDISASIIRPDCIRIRSNNKYVYPGRGKTCVQNGDQFVCAALGKPFKSNCLWRKATGNHLHICTSHVNDDASAMTISSQTCLRAENSSSSYALRKMTLAFKIFTSCD